MPAYIPFYYAMCDALRAAGLGLLLCILYTITRLALPAFKASHFILDISVIVIGAISYMGFCASISYAGITRWYTLASLLIGYFAWSQSGLVLALKFKKAIINVLVWPFKQVYLLVLQPVFRRINKNLLSIKEKRKQKAKIQKQKSKKQLQKTYKVLYNSNYDTLQ